MRLRRLTGVDDFLDAAANFVALDEARHALLLAVTDSLRTRPEFAARRPYLAVVERDGEVVGAAAMIPPNPLVVSPLTPVEALPAVVDDLLDDARAEQVSDVSATPEVVQPFLELWCARAGRTWRPVMRERLHRIDAAPDVPDVPGQFRLATMDDLDQVVDWSVDFQTEAWRGALSIDRDRLRVAGRARIEQRDGVIGLWVLDDGEPVSMAMYFAAGPPVPARVAPVYTPPSLRGHGYGTAVTAALTRLAFERGHRFSMLFTDVENATSNHIYAAIGYRPVCEWMHARVQAGPAV